MGRAEDLFHRLEVKGEEYIDELIETRKSEEGFLDFKRSSNGGSTPKLDIGDRNSLAKALSGFANSEGGVIVWGVDCSRDVNLGDVASAKFPLENPQRFASLLEGVQSGCTVPPVQGCRSIAVPSKSGGYVATLIPRSENAPHQMSQDKRYLIRAGSNFEPVLHGVLAGMFGRHPQPLVHANFIISPLSISENVLNVTCGLMLVNAGSVVAEDCFVSTLTTKKGGANGILNFDHGDAKVFNNLFTTGADFSVMANRDFRLPPGGFVRAFGFNWFIRSTVSDGFRFELTAGCSGAPPYKQTLEISKDTLAANVDNARQLWKDPTSRAQQDWNGIATRILGLVE